MTSCENFVKTAKLSSRWAPQAKDIAEKRSTPLHYKVGSMSATVVKAVPKRLNGV